MMRRPILHEEWKDHVRQTSRQRLAVGLGIPLLFAVYSYDGRPWHELIIPVLLAGICGFLSEISIDLKGMRLMMAEEREGAVRADDPADWD